MAVNRIAYTGSDGNVFTINPDGTDSQRLTTTDLRVGSSGGIILAQGLDNRVFYSWPTWSPDGTKLAVSRTLLGEAETLFSVEVIDVSTGRTTRVYENDPNTFPIAQGAALPVLVSGQRTSDLHCVNAEGASSVPQL